MLNIRSARLRHGLHLADLDSLLLASKRHLDATWLLKLACVRHLEAPLSPATRPPSATWPSHLAYKWNLDSTWPFQLPSKYTLLLALTPNRDRGDQGDQI